MGKRVKTFWWIAGLGALLLAGLVGLLARSTVPRLPGMPITGGIPMGTAASGAGSPKGRMAGMTMPLAPVATRDAHSLVLLPTGEILFGHHDGIQRFDGDKQGWLNVVQRSGWDAMNLAWDGRRLIVAGHEVYAVSDDLRTYRDRRPSGLGGMDIHGYAISPVDPQRHYLWEARSGLYVSQDGGLNWRAAGGVGLSRWVHVLAVARDGSVYAGGVGAGLYRSLDGGGHFEPAGAPEADVFALGVDAGGKLYVGGRQGLYAQDPEGWQRLEPASVIALAASPDEAGYIVWMDDQGQVWQR